MIRTRPALALAAGAVIAAVLTAGCGSSSQTVPSAATTPSTTIASTEQTAPGQTARPAGTATVTIKDFMFKPMSLTVKAGTTVTWTNDDQTPHNVQFSDPSIKTSPDLSAGGGQQSWSHTFTTPGTYHYVCGIHTYMTGTVRVTG